MLVQFIFAGVIVLILIRVYWRFAKGEIKATELVFWTAFWILAGVAFFLPGLATRVANIFGIGRGADFVFYTGFVLVFYIIFRIFVRLDKIEREITELVRRKALGESENLKGKIQKHK